MITRIAICDDDKIQLSALSKQIKEITKNDETKNVLITEFEDSIDLLNEIEDGKRYDLFFLDIEMPHISGMETAKRIKTFLPDCLLIFVTSHTQYAIDSYYLSIFRYILKSQIKERLPDTLKEAIDIIQSNENKKIIIKNHNGYESIRLSNILYIRKNVKNSIFVCKDGREISWRIGLTELLSKLDDKRFIFADRNLIINIEHITSISDGNIVCSDNTVLQASCSQYKKIKKAFLEYFK